MLYQFGLSVIKKPQHNLTMSYQLLQPGFHASCNLLLGIDLMTLTSINTV